MRRPPLFVLYTAAALVILGTTVLLSNAIMRQNSHIQEREIQQEFLHQYTSLALHAVSYRNIQEIGNSQLDDYLRLLAADQNVRLTVIARDGRVLGDSQTDSTLLNNHGSRPEVLAAFSGEPKVSSRISASIGESLVYYALAEQEETPEYVVRAAMPALSAPPLITPAGTLILFSGLLLTALLSYSLNRAVHSGLRILEYNLEQGRQFYKERKPLLDAQPPFHQFTQSLNRLIAQFSAELEQADRQKLELEALFAGMTESVIVLDTDSRIVDVNLSAGRLAGIPRQSLIGRNLLEGFRSTGLADMVLACQKQDAPVEGEILFTGETSGLDHTLKQAAPENNERALRVHVSRITIAGETGEDKIRIVMVLHDITDVKTLENIRKDFVANVSHELKTPVTSIKGYVETLLDGAIEDTATAETFLKIVLAQSDRLQAIIDDLLVLSRLEKPGSGEVQLTNTVLFPAVLSAVDFCSQTTQKKEIQIHIEGDKSVSAQVNQPLIEQALINLIDNAVKYSGEKSHIKITLSRNPHHAVLKIADQGQGIPRSDLPRIFERFYRVDKGRSRDVGGTGLGLSIVKHIVLSHNGDIQVDSAVGHGTVFTLLLPLSASRI